jgi:hypothetical protein
LIASILEKLDLVYEPVGGNGVVSRDEVSDFVYVHISLGREPVAFHSSRRRSASRTFTRRKVEPAFDLRMNEPLKLWCQ